MPTKTTTYRRVDGLQAALRKLPKEAAKQLTDEAKDIAADIASTGSQRAKALGGVAALVAPTIKARRDRRPTVAMGGTRRITGGTVGQVVAGAEFGSKRYSQFSPWTGNGDDAGYFLWPTIRDNEAEYMDRYEGALDKALKSI